MKNINLLPWRATQQRRQYQQFFILIASCLILIIISLFLWRAILMKNIQKVKQHNQQLQKQITELQQQLNVSPVVTTSNVNAQPENLVKFLNHLPELIPPGIYLTQIKKNVEWVDLYGDAQSPQIVLTFVQTMQQVGWKAQIKSLDKRLFHIQIVGV